MSSPETLPAALASRVQLQLATLDRAGVAPVQALALLDLPAAEQHRLRRARQLLEGGQPLAMAGRISGLFSVIESAAIAAASAAGSPAETHRRLGEHAAARAARAKAVRNRLLLPACVLLVAMLVLPLPDLVSGSLSGAWYVGRIGLLLGIGAGLFQVGREIYRRQQVAETWPGQQLFETAILQAPVLGALAVRVQAQRFFEFLALLLESGLPAVDALRHAASTLRIARVREDFEAALPALAAGASLHQVSLGWEYPGDETVPGIIAAGEGSGRLPELLQRHAQMESQRLAERIESLATWLPRLLYVVMSVWLAWSLIGGYAAMLRRSIE